MAISRSNYRDKALYVLGLLSLLLLIQRGGANEFKVGGSNGWSVPSDAQNYKNWAEESRFQIGDTLLFVFPSDKDSVLQVTKEHYTSCNTDKPLAKFTNSPTVFKFDQSGPYYFISGTKDNCLNEEKLYVIALADRTGGKTSPPKPSSDQTQTQTQTLPNNGAFSSIMSSMVLFGAFVGLSIVLGF